MDKKFVVVRCATQNYADLKVEWNLEWTILDFKRYLSQNHASKPDIEKQRLIFAGQLMKNEILLQDYLKKMSENFSPIIHLVCAPDLSRSAPNNPTTPTPKPHL
uniref:Ubiquitin-like domain-containing protein n=1 Tax=Romanomermis culicivorax TaxID=13658 RepID=A0A915KQ19_ROMCU